MRPLVSIVTPTRGRPDKLRRAVRSVLRQTLTSWEYLVVEDGCGEAAEAVLRFSDSRIQVITSTGSGQVEARNTGISIASGRFIALLDDDDWWGDEAHLESVVSLLDRNDGLGFQTGWIVLEQTPPIILPYDLFPSKADFLHYNMLLTSSVVYPQKLHDILGQFDTSMGSYFDWDWYLRLIEAQQPLCGVHRRGVYYSVHESNVSGAFDSPERKSFFVRFCAKHGLSIEIKNHLLMYSEICGIDIQARRKDTSLP
jgi:glycosyltransferase involved in cell wall biosynthesis